MLKFTAEQLAQFGCKTHEELAAKFVISILAAEKLTETVNGYKAKIDAADQTIASLQSGLKTATDALATANSQIAALETATKTETLSALAREQATLVLGATGAPVNNAAPANPTAQPAQSAPTQVEQLNAEGKYEEAWAASDKLKAEFPSGPKVYAAYARANAQGRIEINSR